MTNDDSLTRAIAQEVRISAHDPLWAARFVTERNRLLELLPGQIIAIEHIGSTAVPFLAAKPVIDMLVGVASIEEADALVEPLCANSYATSAEFNATLMDRRWLMRHASGRRTHHLHLAVFGGSLWVRWLRFRDLLRADAILAARYEHLKRSHAERYRQDREAYTQAKTSFINEVLGNSI